jgi:hypothetical protein
MNNEFESLSIDSLKALLVTHQTELEKALLDGVTWQKAQKKRKLVTELSILIHKRSCANPAESETR